MLFRSTRFLPSGKLVFSCINALMRIEEGRWLSLSSRYAIFHLKKNDMKSFKKMEMTVKRLKIFYSKLLHSTYQDFFKEEADIHFYSWRTTACSQTKKCQWTKHSGTRKPMLRSAETRVSGPSAMALLLLSLHILCQTKRYQSISSLFLLFYEF